MASHFSANQYEGAFTSKALQNWEVSKQQRGEPRTLRGYTKIIGDDDGHLLENVPKSKNNPWGNYMGTWDLPRKIAGNSATNTTGRTSLAQQKLAMEARSAQEVLSGSTKNDGRINRLREGERDATARRVAPSSGSQMEAPSGGRSGAEAPATTMLEGGKDSPAPQSSTPQKVTRFASDSPAGRRSGAGSVRPGGDSPTSPHIPRPDFLSPSSRNMAPIKYDVTPEPMSPQNDSPLHNSRGMTPYGTPGRNITPQRMDMTPNLQENQQIMMSAGYRSSPFDHGMSPMQMSSSGMSPLGQRMSPDPRGSSPFQHGSSPINYLPEI